MKNDKRTKEQLLQEISRLKQRVDELRGLEDEIIKADEHTKTSLMKKDILLREIHHRVKNNLQVVMSLLALQGTYINNKRMAEILRECQNRIKSMSLIHEKLYLARDMSDLSVQEYATKLIRSLFISYGAEENGITYDLNMGALRMDIETAVPCGLIITELVSNALKHAFCGGRGGSVKVDMKKLSGGLFELVVQDNGCGLPKGKDYRDASTLGMQLITTLAEDQLRGKLTVTSTAKGTGFKITFKQVRH